MFGIVSSCFNKIKRHFYRAVEDARQPLKRPFDDVSDDDDIIGSSYTPVQKRICPKRDEPFLPMTRTLTFSPTVRHKSMKRSPLRPIPEDEPPQPEVKVDRDIWISLPKKPSSIQRSALHSWTPLFLTDMDTAPSTSRRIIPPPLKTYSKKLSPGSNGNKKHKNCRNVSVKETPTPRASHHSHITTRKHQVRNTKPIKFSSERWKSFKSDESFRMEEKKQYQQLLDHCISGSSHSSSSSNCSSPLPSPVYEVRWPKKSSHSFSSETETENVVPSLSLERKLTKSSKSKSSTFTKKKDCLDDQESCSHHTTGLGRRTRHSDEAGSKSASNGTLKRTETVIKNGKQFGLKEDASSRQLIRKHKEKENSPVPVIDLVDSDIESVVSLKSTSSESDDVEVVDEFPQGTKRNELFKSLLEKERRKYMQDRFGSLTQDAKESEAESASEWRNKISQSFYSKVEDRMKCLDIISKPQEKRSHQTRRVKQPFIQFTPKMLVEVDAALVPVPKSEVLVHKFNIKITRRDIHTLKGLNWLNDEIINFYMNLIMDRSKSSSHLPSVFALNTFLYPKLKSSGYQSVSRWTKRVDIFAYDILLVPIHLNVHWCMASVDFKKKCIAYYDSMLGINDECLELLLDYLQVEHLDKKKTPYRAEGWKLLNMMDIPEQMNGSDCGVFACQFAEHKSRRAQMAFDQEDMPYFRRRMIYEITHAKLLDSGI